MLTFHYIPYTKIQSLESKQKIDHILDLVRKDNIIIIEGRLKSTEEANLIRETMSVINKNYTFHGIEIGTFHNDAKGFKSKIAKWLIGEKTGLTIIGPANIIRELKQHPEKIELHFQKDFLKSKK